MWARGAHQQSVKRRGFKVVSGAACVLIFTGCAAMPEPVVQSETKATYLSRSGQEHQLRSLTQHLSCASVIEVSNDLTFYDDVLGQDCYLRSDDVVVVRVFHASSSVAQVLTDDWEPSLGDDRQVVSGKNWFVVGPPKELTRFENIKGREEGPSSTIPSPEPLTERQSSLTTCGRFLSSAVRAYIFSPSDYPGDSDEFRKLFPGANKMIHSELSPAVLGNLRSMPEDQVMAAVTDYLPNLKALCKSAPKAEVATQ